MVDRSAEIDEGPERKAIEERRGSLGISLLLWHDLFAVGAS